MTVILLIAALLVGSKHSSASTQNADLQFKIVHGQAELSYRIYQDQNHRPRFEFSTDATAFDVPMTDVDFTYLRQKLIKLPSVKVLPDSCRRSHYDVRVLPDDKKPRATCFSEKTLYRAAYADVAEDMVLARQKYQPIKKSSTK